MSASPEQLYEQTLVIRSQLGDEPAFAELVRLFGPRLLTFVQRMMQSSPILVADLMQDVWLAIFRGLPRLLDTGKFHPWAFRIARDRIYREYRRRHLSVIPLDETILEEVPTTDDGLTTMEWEELEDCLNTLSPEHRETLMLRFLEEMSYDDIARVTGATVGTVRSRIHYGKRALRRAWKEKEL